MPVRTFSFLILAMMLATVSCGERETAPRPQGAAARGAAFYSSLCGQCHGAAGQGLGRAFPPLAGSEWVEGDEEQLVRIILYGLQGPIEVKGQQYRGLMVGFDRQLSDEDAAAVATYIRSSWGNDAPPVSPSTVVSVRSEPNPGRPLQGSELQQP
jgi:mono/diheme cytochrome c family protein